MTDTDGDIGGAGCGGKAGGGGDDRTRRGDFLQKRHDKPPGFSVDVAQFLF
jgi:hypothetical protein